MHNPGPTHLPPIEAAEASKSRFVTVLRSADIPSLVHYLVKAGAKVEKIDVLPDQFRKYISSKDFKRQAYSWTNPTLYALADHIVVELALDELLSRLQDRPSQ